MVQQYAGIEEEVRTSMSSGNPGTSALGSGLIVDIDRHRVRAVLVDTVGGHGRFISSAAASSTIQPPVGDGYVAARQVIEKLEEETGVSLLGQGGVQSPRDQTSGVDFVALTGQPAEPVKVMMLPAGNADLLGMLVAAARRTPSVVEILGRNARTDDGILSGTLLESEIRRFAPEMIVVVDGQNAQSEWATIVGTLSSLCAEGVLNLIVIVARDQLQQQAAQAMGEIADLRGIDPADFDSLDIAAAIEVELHTLNEQRFDISRLLPADRAATYTNRVRAGDLVTTFLARRRGQSVLAVSASDGVIIHSATPTSNLTVNRPDVDSHANIRTMLKLDSRQILGWLPFPVSEEELHHWMLNRSLRPFSVSSSARDRLMEYAVTTAAIRASWGEPDANPNRKFDLVVGGAALASWSSPALALMSLLNAIQPDSGTGVVEVHLDQDGLLHAAGAIGDVSPALAADVVERDFLMPLATVINVRGSASEGSTVAQGEIRYADGTTQSFSVAAGRLVRLDLDAGTSAVVTIKCEEGSSIGGAESGSEVTFGEKVQLVGGVLGIVIDGRNSVDPATGDLQSQTARVSAWLNDLGEKELNR